MSTIHPKTEVDSSAFFKGWPTPGPEWTLYTSFDSETGPTHVIVRYNEKCFTRDLFGAFRSPHSPYVIQVDFDIIRSWDDGTLMSEAERRCVAWKIMSQGDCQLYATAEDQAMKRPT